MTIFSSSFRFTRCDVRRFRGPLRLIHRCEVELPRDKLTFYRPIEVSFWTLQNFNSRENSWIETVRVCETDFNLSHIQSSGMQSNETTTTPGDISTMREIERKLRELFFPSSCFFLFQDSNKLIYHRLRDISSRLWSAPATTDICGDAKGMREFHFFYRKVLRYDAGSRLWSRSDKAAPFTWECCVTLSRMEISDFRSHVTYFLVHLLGTTIGDDDEKLFENHRNEREKERQEEKFFSVS